jgi:hypothetical protein
MIGADSDNNANENATGIEVPGGDTPPVESPAQATDIVWTPDPTERTCSPLEWYLMKLLEPFEDAPQERAPMPVDQEFVAEEPEEETPAPQPLDAVLPQESQSVPEPPRESKLSWQSMEEETLKTPAAPTEAHPTAPSSQPKPKPKTSIRSYGMKEKADGRQKLMIALIPILAIAMVFLLKNPLGMRSAAKAAGMQHNETARTVVPDVVEIAWTIPAPYELGGRDPMKPVPPPAVENTGQETAARPTETPVELILTGILYSEDKPMAIVDTQVVHEGQQVSGATVKKIDKDSVEFERNGRTWRQTVSK